MCRIRELPKSKLNKRLDRIKQTELNIQFDEDLCLAEDSSLGGNRV